MKVPVPPPSITLSELTAEESTRLIRAMSVTPPRDDYRPWDAFRHMSPPVDLTIDLWWFVVRLQRRGSSRPLGLADTNGQEFSYNLPDVLLQRIDDITRRAAGSLTIGGKVLTEHSRDRYIVSSLMDEAISSSQLEGASTSRVEARKMLESGRMPTDLSERMIFNNFQAMSMLRDRLAEPMTPDLICDIHRVVTDGTLDDPDDAGRLQRPGDDRVRIFGDGEQVLHVPPPAAELPERIAALCAFLNATEPWIPPVLKAFTAHFMVGHDHYFADGNGRTARALFYWVMLKNGFWATEYLVVSQLLREGPAKYARSFLLTEQDAGDLTHFFLFHSQVVVRAMDRLTAYLESEIDRTKVLRSRIRGSERFNLRQMAILDSLIDDPDHEFDAITVARQNHVSSEAARQDLGRLTELGVLERGRRGHRYVWTSAPDWQGRILTDGA